MSHPCPVTNCSRTVPGHEWFCGKHWDRTPETLKIQLRKTSILKNFDEARATVLKALEFLNG